MSRIICRTDTVNLCPNIEKLPEHFPKWQRHFIFPPECYMLPISLQFLGGSVVNNPPWVVFMRYGRNIYLMVQLRAGLGLSWLQEAVSLYCSAQILPHSMCSGSVCGRICQLSSRLRSSTPSRGNSGSWKGEDGYPGAPPPLGSGLLPGTIPSA